MTKKKKKKHTAKKPLKEKPLKGRERRIANAAQWLSPRRGGKPSNLLKRYRKEFRVDWACAIAELQELGIEFDEVYLKVLRENIARDFPDEKKHTPISRWEFSGVSAFLHDSDENFSFIAGYTSGGAPYGVPWEETESPGPFCQIDPDDVEDEEKYPF